MDALHQKLEHLKAYMEGLGSAVSECLVKHYPVNVLSIGIEDVFGESGAAIDLIKKYGLDAESIANRIRKFVNN